MDPVSVVTLKSYPTIKCDICNWVKSTFWHRGGQCSTLRSQYFFLTFLQKRKGSFLNTLRKIWESLVAIQLPSDCGVVFWSNESEKQDTITFCTILPKKERSSIYGHVRWQWPQAESISLFGNVTWQWLKNDAYISTKMQLQNHSLIFLHKNKTFRSPTSILSRSLKAYNTFAS